MSNFWIRFLFSFQYIKLAERRAIVFYEANLLSSCNQAAIMNIWWSLTLTTWAFTRFHWLFWSNDYVAEISMRFKMEEEYEFCGLLKLTYWLSYFGFSGVDITLNISIRLRKDRSVLVFLVSNCGGSELVLFIKLGAREPLKNR